MLKVIESESSAWTIIAEEGELHIYAREDEGEWSEVALSEDSERIEGDMSALLEELYLRETDGQERDEPRGEEDEDSEEDEEPEGDEELEEDEEPEEPEAFEDSDEEDEEPAERPRRRRSKTAARR